MILSIVCICGENYDVDFEPVDGKVPGPVHCPGCGADSTAIVTRKLLQALAAAPPEIKPTLVEEAPAAPSHCAKHPRADIEIFCFVCKKPMCQECMEQFGFVCSPYCRRRGEELQLDIPVYESQRSVVAERQHRRGKQITTLIGLLAILLVTGWIWYVSFGSRPHVEFRLNLSEADQPLVGRFIGPDQVLLVTHWRATLYNVATRKEVWSISLPNITATTVQVTDRDLWLRSVGSILQVDRKTGRLINTLNIPGDIQDLTTTESSIAVVSRLSSEVTLLTQISLPYGAIATNTVAVPESLRLPEETSPDDNVPAPILQRRRDQFFASDAGIVHLIARLEKPNVVVQTTMKKENSRGVSSEVRVTETSVFAEDLMNDMRRQRTGGVRKVDGSTYSVTLQRQFGQPVADWSGQLIGPPSLFPLATVDVLLAGQRLIVFDHDNHPLWEATLAYEVDKKFTPCVESRGSLYVFDQGVLTAYELRTGAVRWRLPSVGISKLTFDDKGLLYVSSTSAGLEAIQYADQLNTRDKVVPVILKIDPATGKTLWRTERLGDTCYQSGRFLYFTRSQQSSLGMLTSTGAAGSDAAHFRVLRASPGNGESDWEYYQPGAPLTIDFQDNRILLLNDRDLQILKFFSL